MAAIEKGDIEIIQLLLSIPDIDLKHIIKSGYHTDNYTNSQREWQEKSELYIVVEKGDVQVIRLLLNHPNIDPNYKYRYEYFQDEFRREDQIQRMPLKFRGFENYIFSTVLTIAIEKNLPQVVKALVESPKVDVNVTKTESRHSFSSGESSHYEKSPLWLAVSEENTEIVKICYKDQKLTEILFLRRMEKN